MGLYTRHYSTLYIIWHRRGRLDDKVFPLIGSLKICPDGESADRFNCSGGVGWGWGLYKLVMIQSSHRFGLSPGHFEMHYRAEYYHSAALHFCRFFKFPECSTFCRIGLAEVCETSGLLTLHKPPQSVEVDGFPPFPLSSFHFDAPKNLFHFPLFISIHTLSPFHFDAPRAAA